MRFPRFCDLAVSYLADLHGYSRHLVTDPRDAEDLVQDTYERAFTSWRQLRDPLAARAWLFRIMLTTFLNKKRKASRHSLLEAADALESLPDPAPPLDEIVAARLEIDAIEAALDRLPNSAREVVLLADVWGFEYGEIATILGCPVGTVRSRLHRARSRLTMELAGRPLAGWPAAGSGREGSEE